MRSALRSSKAAFLVEVALVDEESRTAAESGRYGDDLASLTGDTDRRIKAEKPGKRKQRRDERF